MNKTLELLTARWKFVDDRGIIYTFKYHKTDVKWKEFSEFLISLSKKLKKVYSDYM